MPYHSICLDSTKLGSPESSHRLHLNFQSYKCWVRAATPQFRMFVAKNDKGTEGYNHSELPLSPFITHCWCYPLNSAFPEPKNGAKTCKVQAHCPLKCRIKSFCNYGAQNVDMVQLVADVGHLIT